MVLRTAKFGAAEHYDTLTMQPVSNVGAHKNIKSVIKHAKIAMYRAQENTKLEVNVGKCTLLDVALRGKTSK